MFLAYVRNERELAPANWERLLAQVPPEIGEQAGRYRRWQDRQASLFGKLLLRTVCTILLGEPTDLGRLTHDAYRRPRLEGYHDFDFNISHTDGLVVCVGAVGAGRVGVDVERRLPIRLEEFRRVFTDDEYGRLTAAEHLLEDFYRLWTRKESVMKADGRGFHLDARTIDALAERITVGNRSYDVKSLALTPDHSCHVAAASLTSVRLRSCGVEDWLSAGGLHEQHLLHLRRGLAGLPRRIGDSPQGEKTQCDGQQYEGQFGENTQ
ncbi:4'-phosphopantetheinyl transferase superfamily protein [Lewinella sp. JB7]|uniref:4'-phosphopantetheinyl transferase family protein n=1 Tax=Lewinella sp. JB7 TaxID=2962887 RepID=UPI0020C9E546|nr:4'-phosphopantetheinyl transferase superfamily protein [Lewinella sp. JB7]